MMIVPLQNVTKNLENGEKRKTWKCEYLLNHAINFSVWYTTTFYECFNLLRGCMMIVSLQNVPENVENLQIMGNLKMWISTKPCYKLFSVVDNYILRMFQLIARIYDDRISPKCPRKLRKFAKKENLKMRICNKPCYKLFSVVHNCFLWMCLIIERIYDDRIPPKCHQKLGKWREKENLKMRISTKPCYKLFSVVHNYILWMFQLIARMYDDRISPKCPRKLRKFADNGKPENVNIYKTMLQTLQYGSRLLSMNVSNHWEDIRWSYPSKCPQKLRKNARTGIHGNANIYLTIL